MLVFAIIVVSSILLMWFLFRNGEGDERRDRHERHERRGETEEDKHEILYATTPINKVDDYEFSRIFGYEKDGRMVVPPQDFNQILGERRFDWPDKPMSSDARKPLGIVEGFTADGRLSSRSTKEAILGERRRSGKKGEGSFEGEGSWGQLSPHEEKEVERLVEEAYSGEPDYAPVLTHVGGNHWAVEELVPRRRDGPVLVVEDDKRRGGKREWEERYGASWEDRVDPFFPSSGHMMGEGTRQQRRDPFSGPVPNMERMFGPTFDHADWVVKP